MSGFGFSLRVALTVLLLIAVAAAWALLRRGTRPGKTLPVRRWLGIGLITIFFTPVAVVAAVNVLWVRPTGEVSDAQAFEQVQPLITQNPARWSDPAWQTELQAAAHKFGVDVDLIDANGVTIYRSSADPLGTVGVATGTRATNRVVKTLAVPDPAGGANTVRLYSYPLNFPSLHGAARLVSDLLPLIGLAALALTIAAIAASIGPAILRPLAAMSGAARRIAAGQLDVALPSSRVHEVAEVSAAFSAMGNALRASLERQAQLEQERRLVITAVAHDLRTPLFSLRGYLEGLETGLAATPAKAARYIRVCREQADVLDRLVSDLFAYTRAEYLEQTPQHEALEFGTLLRQIVEGLQPQAAAGDVTIILDGPEQATPLAGDPHLLGRALGNILENALRFTPAAGEVRLRWRAAAGRLVFSVADTGPGIAPRDLPHLFDPLYRAEASRNRKTGGAGLGLTIARRLLRAHGGDLTAANGAGGGAIFTGVLPLDTHAAGTTESSSAEHGVVAR
jgi:signal transduction histidine kinase